MNFKSTICLLAICAAGFTSCSKHSSHQVQNYELILRPDSTTGQDSYVALLDHDAADGNANINFAHELVMGRWTMSWDSNDSATMRGYLRFDGLSQIPTHATVTSATLYLYGEGTDSSASFPFGDSYPDHASQDNSGYLQMVTGGTWDQKTITWNNAPAATADGQVAIPTSTTSWNYNTTIDITNLVQKQVTNPSTNYGYMLKLQVEQLYRAMEFASCESPDSLERPRLVVQYSY